MRLTLLRIFFLLLLSIPSIGLADQGDWKVARASDQVNLTLDKKAWTPVHTGDVVPNGAWVSTGERGRVQLTRGVESITFQPGTLAAVFTTGFLDTKTEVAQQKGTLDLEIEKRDHPHASVQTPFLAAVVKGTIFRVSVAPKSASVAVTRGLVQVTSFNSGQQSNVGPKQTAKVDSLAGMTVTGMTTTPKIVAVPRSLPKVPTAAPTTPEASAAPSKAANRTESSTNDSDASTSQSSSAASNGDSHGNGSGSSGGNHGGNSGGHSSGNANGSSNGQGNSGNGTGSGQGNNGKGHGDGDGNGQGNNGKGHGNGDGNGHSNGNGQGNGRGNGNGHGNNGNGNG